MMTKPSSKTTRVKSRWTLVAINDQGRTVTFGFRIKWFLAGILLAATALAFLFFILLQTVSDRFGLPFEVPLSGKTPQVQNQELISLTNENHLLREKLRDAISQIDAITQKDQDKSLSEGDPPDETGPEAPSDPQPRNSETQARETQPEPPQTSEPDDSDPRSVTLEDFTVETDDEDRRLGGTFKLINTTPDNTNVSGYVFVILEPSGGTGGNPLVYPESTWNGEQPENFEQGRRFSMANFSKIQFDFTIPPDQPMDAFRGVTVIVYDKFQKLLLKTALQIPEEAQENP
jgi:hypothetical protein